VAGEADCDAFISCSGSNFVEMFVGRGAARVRSIFQEARKVAHQNHSSKYGYGGNPLWGWLLSGTPPKNEGTLHKHSNRLIRPPTAIIFIDEFDALAKSRSSGLLNSSDERDQTLNQLLTELDGFFDKSVARTGRLSGSFPVVVIVIAATNRPETLDPAILRRFDRQIYVPLPDARGHMAILKLHASKTNCRLMVHWENLANQTANFSGSDLKQVVNDAALLVVREKSKRVEQGHFIQAIQRAKTMKVQKVVQYGSSSFSFNMTNKIRNHLYCTPFCGFLKMVGR
jgi:cell division protease FtsH